MPFSETSKGGSLRGGETPEERLSHKSKEELAPVGIFKFSIGARRFSIVVTLRVFCSRLLFSKGRRHLAAEALLMPK